MLVSLVGSLLGIYYFTGLRFAADGELEVK
jgi:hypothetical protein